MVLVDTSVWIRFVANRVPFAQELDRLLAIDEVAGHEMIYGELLVGGHGERQELLAAYELIHQVCTIPHRDVIEFVRHRSLYGRGVGWVDVHLLASALVSHLRLWTVDSHLHSLASELGVSYRL